MSDRIRLVTANLWNGAVDPQGLAAAVESLEADVVCTQELAPEQAEALASVLPHGQLEPATDHLGGGIALRRPARLERVPLPLRDARVARLEPADWPGLGAPLEVISVHVLSVHVWPWLRSGRVRRGQLRGLETYLDAAPARARVLAGDLNATPVWPVYRRLARRLRDAPLEVARRRGARPPRTWGPTPGSPPLLRIDHALVDGVHVEDARTVRLPGGDHHALVVDLSVEGKPPLG